MTLSSESCLFCKISSWTGPGTPGPPGKCSTLSCIHCPAANFPRTLKASDQLISRDGWAIYSLGQKHSSNVHPEPTRHGHFVLCPPTSPSQALSDTWHKPFPWAWGMRQCRKSCPWVSSNVPTDPYHYLQAHPQLISPNTFSNLI